MKVCLPLRFLLVVCLILFAAGSVAASTDTLKYIGTITESDTTRSINLFEKFNWHVEAKFRDGTSVVCQTADPDTLFKSKGVKSASFTTDFIVDTALLQKIISLHYELEGSVSISVNGSTIVATGVYATREADRRQTQDDFRELLLTEKVVQMQIDFLSNEYNKLNLEIELYQKQAADDKIERRIESENDDNRAGFYYLAFGIVFITLFVFSKEKKENLYFSLFCLFAALSFLWDGLQTDFLDSVSSFWGIYCFEFLSIFFCKILLNKERSKKPLIAITIGLLFCLLPQVKYASIAIRGSYVPWLLAVVVVGAYLYVIASVLFYLIKGLGQKSWEARAVLVVCFAPIVLYVLVFFGVILYAAYQAKANDSKVYVTKVLFEYLTTVIVYLYPLAAVFILGRRNGLNQRKLIAQLNAIRQLSDENLAKEQEKKEILEGQKEALEKEVAIRTLEIVSEKEKTERQHEELKIEKEKSDELLRNILPEEVANELKATGTTTAMHYDNVTVLFTDFVNFTQGSENMSAQNLIDELHSCFKAFDEITAKYRIEKIKTIGDAYLAVAGMPTADPLHAENIVRAAQEITAFMEDRLGKLGTERTFQIRIGIHSGSVVAGIVGVKKFAYDIWGDTVNTAARMEQNSEAGKINISQTTYELVKDKFSCEYRGEVEAKGKGVMKMYFVAASAPNGFGTSSDLS